MAVSSIGVTGSLAHVVVKRHEKAKLRIPEAQTLPPDGLPRLFIVSGRNEEGLKEVLQKVNK